MALDKKSFSQERFREILAEYQALSRLPFDPERALERVKQEFLEVALYRTQEASDHEATFWACYVMLFGDPDNKKRTLAEIISLLESNVAAGHVPSFWLLGKAIGSLWEEEISEASYRKGRLLIALAARKGYFPAMGEMIDYFTNQLVHSRFYTGKAYSMAQNLAAKDYPVGHFHLGTCALLEDMPGPKGNAVALEHFEKAYQSIDKLDFVDRSFEGRIKFRLGFCRYENGQQEDGLRLIREARDQYDWAASRWLEDYYLKTGEQDDCLSGMIEGRDDLESARRASSGADNNAVIKLKKPFSFQLEIEEKIREREKKEFTPEEIGEILKPLNDLIGLDQVKTQVRELVQYAQVVRRRRQVGLDTSGIGLHMVFSGNPGTGKTTVARILGKILTKLGYLSTGNFIEVDRSGLTGEYIGETTQKTRAAADNARGGILFIDEAHALIHPTSSRDFGWEAVDTLVKVMEDRREDFVVIAAGYKGEIEQFINANTGLASRFTWKIEFPDYTASEIVAIFQNMCDAGDYLLSEEAAGKLALGIRDLARREGRKFANGRTARKLFEGALRAQAERLMREDLREKEALQLILPEDIRFDYPVNDGPVTFLPKK